MLIDFAVISLLIVVSHLLRWRLRWIGKALLPTSIIAGALGLIGGPELLDILPFTRAAGGAANDLQISQYPGILIVFVFATLLLGRGNGAKESLGRRAHVRQMLFYSLGAEIAQFGLAILIGLTILPAIYPGTPELLGVMLPAGFAGGHGTASIFGQAFADARWQDSLSVGFALATIGLLVSVGIGLPLINVGVRKGWIRVASDVREKVGSTFAHPGSQSSWCEASVNPIALDPLSWYLALVGSVVGLTYGFDALLHRMLPGEYWIPQFAVAMLLGVLVQKTLDAVGVGQYIDRTTMRRIGSTSADLLVAFGIASIKLSIVWNYAGPVVLMSLFGSFYALGVFCVARWVFGKQWFERAIFTFGWTTGVVGFGIALLRVVDPRFKSHTLEDYGTSYLLIGPVELLLYPAIIWACLFHHFWLIGIALTLVGGALFVAARTVRDGRSRIGGIAATKMLVSAPLNLQENK